MYRTYFTIINFGAHKIYNPMLSKKVDENAAVAALQARLELSKALRILASDLRVLLRIS